MFLIVTPARSPLSPKEAATHLLENHAVISYKHNLPSRAMCVYQLEVKSQASLVYVMEFRPALNFFFF